MNTLHLGIIIVIIGTTIIKILNVIYIKKMNNKIKDRKPMNLMNNTVSYEEYLKLVSKLID